jgi:hypothetical protein
MVWYNIRKFATAQFIVTLAWQQDEEQYPDWMDAEERARIDSGEWTNACFRVAVWWRGHEIAAEYLGNSVYANVADFGREHIGIKRSSYFPQMLREAIAGARKVLRNAPRMREAN